MEEEKSKELTCGSASINFEEIGGLKLVQHLARSNAPSSLKEVALYTVVSLAKFNVFCQESLCTPELFGEITKFIVDEESSVNLQTVSVSILLAVISANRTGQMLLRETGCIPVLQKLFRETLIESEIDSSIRSRQEKYSLWYTVCNALSAAVSNPPNEENQKICSSILPYAQNLLETRLKPDIVHPLSSFIGLVMAENPPIQEFFISVGGLDGLAEVFTKLVGDSRENIPSAKMAVAVSSTMGVCIAHNPPGSRILVKHQVVPKLLTLLLLESLDSGEKTNVLVTLGCCIELCEQNLNSLLWSDDLKFVINLLADSHYEALSNVIFIVLRNCTILAENLLEKLLAFIPQDASEKEKQRKALECLKKMKSTLLELFKKEEDEEQGPKTEGVVGYSLLKGNDQEMDLPKQDPELGAQIYHPPANNEFKNPLESPGGDPASTLSSKQEPVCSEPMVEHPAPAVEKSSTAATKRRVTRAPLRKVQKKK
ncbi:telomere repeats-binding bouquet formation protein 1-like [Tachyglossus aculeatus]|uniref:telomere repeats-binding bouquet formation protein 1-like n=1 Tax=Tachyglossus aculeatus TaxID=9261 RepID=UPI0018F623F7|nr:telomere repeats-binding bouquet formation protein 1-like [Tachyglossus aculeatus]XP_038596176.1 telomere repeats-binding bouquet formation protein 1-like [Tachyglossus aculeatus]